MTDKSVNSLVQQALREKLYAAEQHISWVRLVIILFNSFIYVFLFEGDNRIPWLAWTIIIVGNLYSVCVLVFKPYKKFSILRSSYFSTISDTLLITFWVMATGFTGSPFYIISYVSIIAIAMRYSIKETFIASVIYLIGYSFVLYFEEGDVIHAYELATRLGYIPIAALLGIYFSGELEDQINDKAKAKKAGLTDDAQNVFAVVIWLNDLLNKIVYKLARINKSYFEKKNLKDGNFLVEQFPFCEKNK